MPPFSQRQFIGSQRRNVSGFARLFYEGIVRSWWVFLFGVLCYGGYELAEKRLQSVEADLKGKITAHQAELVHKQEMIAHLQDQIQSQADLEWIELTLMSELGLVPEGQRKVFFDPRMAQDDG